MKFIKVVNPTVILSVYFKARCRSDVSRYMNSVVEHTRSMYMTKFNEVIKYTDCRIGTKGNDHFFRVDLMTDVVYLGSIYTQLNNSDFYKESGFSIVSYTVHDNTMWIDPRSEQIMKLNAEGLVEVINPKDVESEWAQNTCEPLPPYIPYDQQFVEITYTRSVRVLAEMNYEERTRASHETNIPFKELSEIIIGDESQGTPRDISIKHLEPCDPFPRLQMKESNADYHSGRVTLQNLRMTTYESTASQAKGSGISCIMVGKKVPPSYEPLLKRATDILDGLKEGDDINEND